MNINIKNKSIFWNQNLNDISLVFPDCFYRQHSNVDFSWYQFLCFRLCIHNVEFRKYEKKINKLLHVLPVNDLKEHKECPYCHCRPEIDWENNVCVHNSYDKREIIEQANDIIEKFS